MAELTESERAVLISEEGERLARLEALADKLERQIERIDVLMARRLADAESEPRSVQSS